MNAGTAEIDSRALMADLSAVWNTGKAFVPPPRASSAVEQVVAKENAIVSTVQNGDSVEHKMTQLPVIILHWLISLWESWQEVSKKSLSLQYINFQRQQLLLDPYADTDDVYKEETIDLVDFLDDKSVLDESLLFFLFSVYNASCFYI